MTFTRQDTKSIKAIAVMLMLWHHLFTFPVRFPAGYVVESFFTLFEVPAAVVIGIFGDICVDLFLFLGGYGTYLSCQGKDNVPEITLRKMGGLYREYWKVFFVFVPLCYFLEAPRVTDNGVVFIRAFLGIDTSYSGEWWFLTPYLILLLVYPIIHYFMKKRRPGFGIELLVVVFIAALELHVLPALLARDWAVGFASSSFWQTMGRAPRLLPAFLSGCVFAKYDVLSRIKERCADRWQAVVLAILAIGAVFYLRSHTDGTHDCLYAPVLVAACAVILNYKKMSVLNRGLAYLGGKSTSMWLTHTFFCYVLIPNFIYSPKIPILVFLLLYVITLACAIAIEQIYKWLGIGIKKLGTLMRAKA